MPDKEATDIRLKHLGLAVKKYRERLSLSQADLAYKIDKDQPSINRLERGRINPSYIYLLEICEGLEIELKDLVALDEHNCSESNEIK